MSPYLRSKKPVVMTGFFMLQSLNRVRPLLPSREKGARYVRYHNPNRLRPTSAPHTSALRASAIKTAAEPKSLARPESS